MNTMMQWTKEHENNIKRALLVAALGVFVAAVSIYLLDRLLPAVSGVLPSYLVPASLLSAITPAISVLLVYELLLLTLSAGGPFIVFIRHQFEVISLIVLRDLFKKMDELAATDTVSSSLLTDLAIIGVGSIVLYFFVEILERIEKRFVNGDLKHELPKNASFNLHRFKNWLEAGLLIFFTVLTVYEAIGWSLGVAGTGFNSFFLEMVFSALIIYNVFLLFITLLATDGYEILFEHSALLLASITVLIAFSKDTAVAIPLIIAALLFVIATLFLHGFARGQSMRQQIRNLKTDKR